MRNHDKNEIVNNLTIQAKKLAIILDNANISQDVKDALAAILPQMTLEQIDRLLNIMEAKYLDEQTGEIDEKYKKELERLVEEFKKAQFTNKNKLLDQIKQLAKIYE